MDRFFVGGNEPRNDRIPRKAALDAIPTSCPEFRPSARVLCELSEDLRQGLGLKRYRPLAQGCLVHFASPVYFEQ